MQSVKNLTQLQYPDSFGTSGGPGPTWSNLEKQLVGAGSSPRNTNTMYKILRNTDLLKDC